MSKFSVVSPNHHKSFLLLPQGEVKAEKYTALKYQEFRMICNAMQYIQIYIFKPKLQRVFKEG